MERERQAQLVAARQPGSQAARQPGRGGEPTGSELSEWTAKIKHL